MTQPDIAHIPESLEILKSQSFSDVSEGGLTDNDMDMETKDGQKIRHKSDLGVNENAAKDDALSSVTTTTKLSHFIRFSNCDDDGSSGQEISAKAVDSHNNLTRSRSQADICSETTPSKLGCDTTTNTFAHSPSSNAILLNPRPFTAQPDFKNQSNKVALLYSRPSTELKSLHIKIDSRSAKIWSPPPLPKADYNKFDGTIVVVTPTKPQAGQAIQVGQMQQNGDNNDGLGCLEDSADKNVDTFASRIKNEIQLKKSEHDNTDIFLPNGSDPVSNPGIDPVVEAVDNIPLFPAPVQSSSQSHSSPISFSPSHDVIMCDIQDAAFDPNLDFAINENKPSSLYANSIALESRTDPSQNCNDSLKLSSLDSYFLPPSLSAIPLKIDLAFSEDIGKLGEHQFSNNFCSIFSAPRSQSRSSARDAQNTWATFDGPPSLRNVNRKISKSTSAGSQHSSFLNSKATSNTTATMHHSTFLPQLGSSTAGFHAKHQGLELFKVYESEMASPATSADCVLQTISSSPIPVTCFDQPESLDEGATEIQHNDSDSNVKNNDSAAPNFLKSDRIPISHGRSTNDGSRFDDLSQSNTKHQSIQTTPNNKLQENSLEISEKQGDRNTRRSCSESILFEKAAPILKRDNSSSNLGNISVLRPVRSSTEPTVSRVVDKVLSTPSKSANEAHSVAAKDPVINKADTGEIPLNKLNTTNTDSSSGPSLQRLGKKKDCDHSHPHVMVNGWNAEVSPLGKQLSVCSFHTDEEMNICELKTESLIPGNTGMEVGEIKKEASESKEDLSMDDNSLLQQIQNISNSEHLVISNKSQHENKSQPISPPKKRTLTRFEPDNKTAHIGKSWVTGLSLWSHQRDSQEVKKAKTDHCFLIEQEPSIGFGPVSKKGDEQKDESEREDEDEGNNSNQISKVDNSKDSKGKVTVENSTQLVCPSMVSVDLVQSLGSITEKKDVEDFSKPETSNTPEAVEEFGNHEGDETFDDQPLSQSTSQWVVSNSFASFASLGAGIENPIQQQVQLERGEEEVVEGHHEVKKEKLEIGSSAEIDEQKEAIIDEDSFQETEEKHNKKDSTLTHQQLQPKEPTTSAVSSENSIEIASQNSDQIIANPCGTLKLVHADANVSSSQNSNSSSVSESRRLDSLKQRQASDSPTRPQNQDGYQNDFYNHQTTPTKPSPRVRLSSSASASSLLSSPPITGRVANFYLHRGKSFSPPQSLVHASCEISLLENCELMNESGGSKGENEHQHSDGGGETDGKDKGDKKKKEEKQRDYNDSTERPGFGKCTALRSPVSTQKVYDPKHVFSSLFVQEGFDSGASLTQNRIPNRNSIPITSQIPGKPGDRLQIPKALAGHSKRGVSKMLYQPGLNTFGTLTALHGRRVRPRIAAVLPNNFYNDKHKKENSDKEDDGDGDEEEKEEDEYDDDGDTLSRKKRQPTPVRNAPKSQALNAEQLERVKQLQQRSFTLSQSQKEGRAGGGGLGGAGPGLGPGSGTSIRYGLSKFGKVESLHGYLKKKKDC